MHIIIVELEQPAPTRECVQINRLYSGKDDRKSNAGLEIKANVCRRV
jgi:hypothetical protein